MPQIPVAVDGGISPKTGRGKSQGCQLRCWQCDGCGCWYVIGEAQALTRDGVRTIPFTGIDTTGQGEVVIIQSTNELQFDCRVRTRLTLGRRIGENNLLEISYFGFQSFVVRSERGDANGELPSPFSGFDPFFFGTVVGFDCANIHQL